MIFILIPAAIRLCGFYRRTIIALLIAPLIARREWRLMRLKTIRLNAIRLKTLRHLSSAPPCRCFHVNLPKKIIEPYDR